MVALAAGGFAAAQAQWDRARRHHRPARASRSEPCAAFDRWGLLPRFRGDRSWPSTAAPLEGWRVDGQVAFLANPTVLQVAPSQGALTGLALASITTASPAEWTGSLPPRSALHHFR